MGKFRGAVGLAAQKFSDSRRAYQGRHKVVSLPGAVKRAAQFRATPQLVFGLKSGVCDLDLVRLLFSGEAWCENARALATLPGAQASALAPARSGGTSQDPEMAKGKSTNGTTEKKTTRGEENKKKLQERKNGKNIQGAPD